MKNQVISNLTLDWEGFKYLKLKNSGLAQMI